MMYHREHAGGDTMTTLGRQQGDDELLAQLRELLILPSPATTTVINKAMVSGGPHACDDGRRRRRCRRGSKKRPRDDDNTTNNGCSASSGKRRSKKQAESTCFVTRAPDFDGYRWRKYGQKQIEGAMYARSYYRCIRSAEQGCPAKRTVQRNDDDGDAPAEFTVVRMGEHTCTATDDSLAAPVILETTAVAAAPDDIIGTSKGGADDEDDDDDTITSAGRSCCSTTTTTGTGVESPAISDDDITWSRGDGYVVVDDYGAGTTLLDVVHDDYSWASSASSLQDFTGPIRSPVHVPQAAGCWSIDHPNFLLQLPNNEPVSHYFSSAC